MNGTGVSINGGRSTVIGPVIFCPFPFPFVARSLIDWGRLRLSSGNGCKSLFCAGLAALFEDEADICRGKADVIGRRSLGVYGGCGDGIGWVPPSIGSAPDIPGAKVVDGAY